MLISTAMMVVGCFFVVGALQLYIRGKFAELDVLDKKLEVGPGYCGRRLTKARSRR